MGQIQKKHALANAEKPIKPKGAARGDYYFLHWPRHVFSAFGPSLFFGLWPMLIFWALAHAYFLGFGPCLFFGLWPPLILKAATFNGLPVLESCQWDDERVRILHQQFAAEDERVGSI